MKQQAEEKIKGRLEGLLGGKKADAGTAPVPGAAPAKGAEAPPSNRDKLRGILGR